MERRVSGPAMPDQLHQRIGVRSAEVRGSGGPPEGQTRHADSEKVRQEAPGRLIQAPVLTGSGLRGCRNPGAVALEEGLDEGASNGVRGGGVSGRGCSSRGGGRGAATTASGRDVLPSITAPWSFARMTAVKGNKNPTEAFDIMRYLLIFVCLMLTIVIHKTVVNREIGKRAVFIFPPDGINGRARGLGLWAICRF